MIIVGELINTSRKAMADAVNRRDEGEICAVAQRQADSGAAYIDVNCGTFLEEEEELLPWLVRIIQEQVDLPLCLDSPNPKALAKALEVHRGKALINSISGEEERFAQVLPLVIESGASVIALCMDDDGIGEDAASRLEAGKKLGERLLNAGIESERIFFDPLLRPVSTESEAGQVALETIARLKLAFPQSHIICGLSNISLDCPSAGSQPHIPLHGSGKGPGQRHFDPTDPEIRLTLLAAEALLGKDEFCLNYLNNIREQEEN